MIIETHIHNFSFHSNTVKHNVISNSFSKTLRICDYEFIEAEIEHLFHTFLSHGYPKNFINGVFGKLRSHQMAVAIIVLIGKKIREIHFGHRALPYILCAYKYIQCL